MSKYTAVRIAETAKISEQKTQIGSDSLVGDSTTVGPRSSVKRSTIGDHVELAENVKVDKSVVMDHVKLGKNVTITGCIIGSNAVVESGCSLTQCVVGPGYTVPADGGLRRLFSVTPTALVLPSRLPV
ncbi:MAG: trimeric LpxA-like protein [Olpidium bornovanus]|uniref:Trimeric LpxA-like protein n=1 Tax=Olpidium bornovanus TaxID=278681 RepID=A0A8H8DL08_9FUNG|nr:MAG: trimeric LpxA-like protein [Olpidium bornovanus]